MMAGEEESLELRIDVSLDQDKYENQEEIIYSQNSNVDVVNLESDSPPLSSDADGGNSQDLNMWNLSAPPHLQRCSDLPARGSAVCHLL